MCTVDDASGVVLKALLFYECFCCFAALYTMMNTSPSGHRAARRWCWLLEIFLIEKSKILKYRRDRRLLSAWWLLCVDIIEVISNWFIQQWNIVDNYSSKMIKTVKLFLLGLCLVLTNNFFFCICIDNCRINWPVFCATLYVDICLCVMMR